MYSMDDYCHQVVNHSENFGDPLYGVHTQGIELVRLDSKSWNHCARGGHVYLRIQFHEATWRKLRAASKRNGTLFGVFVNDMKQVLNIFLMQ